jgi:hypothetical protein
MLGHVFENRGRPDNRVNFVIVGDGYTADQVDTLLIDNIDNMLYGTDGFYSPRGEPYVRYSNFINVCALKLASNDGCIDNGDEGISCDTLFDGACDRPCGASGTRRAGVNTNAVRSAVAENLPDYVDADWHAATVNAGPNNWWNSGGPIMVWNGNYEPQSRAASVGLHEGGHTWHGLADEYGGNDCGRNASQPNVTDDASGAKWAEWLGYDHDPGTGMQGVFEGALYCDSGYYRPSQNAEMNQLPAHHNMPSIQKIIHDIYEIVRPIDAHTDNSGSLANPSELQIRVVDPEVLTIQWTVDGAPANVEGSGECFLTSSLPPGEHTVTVRVFDETEWVRNDRSDLEQSVTWTVSIQ